MPNTLQEIDNSALFPLLDTFRDSIQKLLEDPDIDQKPTIDRFLALANFTISNIENSDRILIPNYALNQATQHLQNAQNELAAYINNKNIGHIEQSSNHIGSVIKFFPQAFHTESPELLENQISRISRITDDLIDQLKSRSNQTINDFSKLTNNIGSMKSEIESERNRISEGLGNVETQFTESQSERSTAFEKALTQFRELHKQEIEASDIKIRSFIDEQTNYFKNRTDEIIQVLNDKLKDSNEKHSEILQIYGIVGRDSQIGGYAKAAQDARIASQFWDRVVFVSSVIAILILIGPSLISYIHDPSQSINWIQVLARIPISSVLFAPAGYAVAQARRQKRLADEAHETQLQLAALGPYLSTLPDETQQKIRSLLTKRFFSSATDLNINIADLYPDSES